MPLLLEGAPVGAAVLERARGKAALLRERGIVPGLALLRLGERPDDLSYARGVKKRAGQAGVNVREENLPAEAGTGAVLETVRRLNADPAVHGVLIFRPLPKTVDDGAVCAALAPEKDLDGVTPAAQAALYAGRGAAPCTPEAVIALLDHYGAEIAGKRALVIGRSLVIGRPVALLLLQRDATVTICHSKTGGLKALCREADIVVAALGKREFLGTDFFRPGQWVVDVGIHSREDGSLAGDVDFAGVSPLVAAITPVPGGTGAVTASLLLERTVRAAE